MSKKEREGQAKPSKIKDKVEGTNSTKKVAVDMDPPLVDSNSVAVPKAKESIPSTATVSTDIPVDSSSKPKGRPVSFDRWFRSKSFKPHWRNGMAAFTDTSVHRTVEEWNKIFETY